MSQKFFDYWNLTIFSSLFQGEQGLVFKDLLRDLEQNIDPNVVFPWFHRVLTKDEAVKMLVRGKLNIFWPLGFDRQGLATRVWLPGIF